MPLCLIGPLRLIYIPNKLFVHGNASATADNIAAHELLFRFGIAADMVCAVILIFLVLTFYRLFKEVDQYLAVLVIILGGVMPSLYLVNVVSDAGALMNLAGTRFPVSVRQSSAGCTGYAPFGAPRASTHRRRDPLGLMAASVRNAYVPVGLSTALSLGVWLVINGFAYVILSFTGVLLPHYQSKVFRFGLPAFFGDLAFMLWLVIKGAKPQGMDETGSSLAAG